MINLHELQKQNLLDGGKCFLLRIGNKEIEKDIFAGHQDRVIEVYCPLKVREEFDVEIDNCNQCIWYNNGFCESADTKVYFDSYGDCEDETKNKKFKVKSIKCVRVQDAVKHDGKLMDYVNSLDDSTYEENGYYFLVEVE